jgi:hypothetical protein
VHPLTLKENEAGKSHRADPAKLLDVEVNKLTRVLALIAADRRGRLAMSS